MKSIVLICIVVVSTCYSQWLNPTSLREVVSIEREDSGGTRPFGTGILFYNYLSRDGLIVVTCAHLIKPPKIFVGVNADSILIAEMRIRNLKEVFINDSKWKLAGNKLLCEIKIDTINKNYVLHKNLDIGAFKINITTSISLDSNKTQQITRVSGIPKSGIRYKKDVNLGEEFYFIGFPFGIGTSNELEPILRSGSLAWKSKFSSEFLLDAMSYGGNSGSPIYSKSIIKKPGELSWDGSYIIGMVIGHYGESLEGLLIQPDPKQNTIVRSEIAGNWGLARCVWMDDIEPIVRLAEKLKSSEYKETIAK
jgi:hypothetical protein